MSDFEPGVAQPHNDINLIAGADSPFDPWVRDAVRALRDENAAMKALTKQSDPKYQWQVFDTKRSRVVLEVPPEEVDEVREVMDLEHWVLRRRVVGPWEEVK